MIKRSFSGSDNLERMMIYILNQNFVWFWYICISIVRMCIYICIYIYIKKKQRKIPRSEIVCTCDVV